MKEFLIKEVCTCQLKACHVTTMEQLTFIAPLKYGSHDQHGSQKFQQSQLLSLVANISKIKGVGLLSSPDSNRIKAGSHGIII